MDIYSLNYQRGYAGLHSQTRDPAHHEYAMHVHSNHGDPTVLADWRGLDLYVNQPSLRIPDFFWHGYYIVCRVETFAKIADVVAERVVPLPVQIEDMPEEHVLLFVTNVIHATRDDDIRAFYAQHGFRDAAYFFKRDCFTQPQIFLNATQFKGQMLCASDGGHATSDFLVQYRRRGLTGIDFRLLRETP